MIIFIVIIVVLLKLYSYFYDTYIKIIFDKIFIIYHYILDINRNNKIRENKLTTLVFKNAKI